MAKQQETSLKDLMLLIELNSVLLKTEHTESVTKNNKSAGRRARVITLKLTRYLKEYRQMSMKELQVPE